MMASPKDKWSGCTKAVLQDELRELEKLFSELSKRDNEHQQQLMLLQDSSQKDRDATVKLYEGRLMELRHNVADLTAKLENTENERKSAKVIQENKIEKLQLLLHEMEMEKKAAEQKNEKLSALEIENTQLKNKLECLEKQPTGNKKQSACNEFIQMQLQLLQCEIRYLNSELKFREYRRMIRFEQEFNLLKDNQKIMQAQISSLSERNLEAIRNQESIQRRARKRRHVEIVPEETASKKFCTIM